MLKILPEWSEAVIVRTRDEAELAKCDAVVDVGGVYDPTILRRVVAVSPHRMHPPIATAA